jgi:hypothetical protein
MGLRPSARLQENVSFSKCSHYRFGQLRAVRFDRRNHYYDRCGPDGIRRTCQCLSNTQFVGIRGNQNRLSWFNATAIHTFHGTAHHLKRA